MNQNRQPAGIPTGGEFAAHDRAEDSITLPVGDQRTVTVAFTTKLDYLEVPEYPQGLPGPDIYFEYDDGQLELTVTLDGARHTFGASASGEEWDSITEPDDFDEPSYFDSQDGDDIDEDELEAQKDAFVEWGRRLRNSLDDAAYGLKLEAVEQVRGEMIATATGFKQHRPNLAERSQKLSRQYAELGAELARVSAAQVARGILEKYPHAATVELFNYEDDRQWSGFAITDADGNDVVEEGELEDLWEHWQAEVNEIPASAPVRFTAGVWLPDEQRFTWLTPDPDGKSATIDLRAAAAQDVD